MESLIVCTRAWVNLSTETIETDEWVLGNDRDPNKKRTRHGKKELLKEKEKKSTRTNERLRHIITKRSGWFNRCGSWFVGT